jgi:hypothetical protein
MAIFLGSDQYKTQFYDCQPLYQKPRIGNGNECVSKDEVGQPSKPITARENRFSLLGNNFFHFGGPYRL